MLHLKRLEHFTLALEHQDLHSSLVELPATSARVFVLPKRIENVLHLQNAALLVHLVDEALLVELNAHCLQCPGQKKLFVLPLDEEADSPHTVSFLGLLKPVVHEGGQVDVVGEAAFPLVHVPLFLLPRTKGKPGVHRLLLQKVAPQQHALFKLGLFDLPTSPVRL